MFDVTAQDAKRQPPSNVLEWLEGFSLAASREQRRQARQERALQLIRSGVPLSHIESHHQTREVRLLALQMNGMALAAIPRSQRTDEMRLAAIQANAQAATLISPHEVAASPRTAQWLMQNWPAVLAEFDKTGGRDAAVQVARTAVKTAQEVVFEGDNAGGSQASLPVDQASADTLAGLNESPQPSPPRQRTS